MTDSRKIHIHLILEGSEEVSFFNIVENCGLNEEINLSIKNAIGSNNIPAYYQDARTNEEYDLVLCVYDVDYKFKVTNSAFWITFNQLISILGSEQLTKMVSFCSNPNILLWFLIGVCKFDELPHISCGKSRNTEILHRFWPKIGNGMEKSNNFRRYDAKTWQLKVLENSYIYGDYSYSNILINGSDIPLDLSTETIGSNLLSLLKALKDGDIVFFNKIMKAVTK